MYEQDCMEAKKGDAPGFEKQRFRSMRYRLMGACEVRSPDT